jgi:hypothetical protein
MEKVKDIGLGYYLQSDLLRTLRSRKGREILFPTGSIASTDSATISGSSVVTEEIHTLIDIEKCWDLIVLGVKDFLDQRVSPRYQGILFEIEILDYDGSIWV